MKLFHFRRRTTPLADPPSVIAGDDFATKADLELVRAELDELRQCFERYREVPSREVSPELQPIVEVDLEETPEVEPEDLTHQGIEDLDIRYMRIIKSLLGRAPRTSVFGELIDLTIIGRLGNGQLAWVNEDQQVFGVIPEILAKEVDLFPDDTIRGRVVSYPWGHIVTALDTAKRSSPFNARPASTSLITTAGVVPEYARGTFRERLVPGDIVVARIPYDGTALPDRKNRIAKERPSVFIRWENDYAILRPIYDVHGHVAGNDLGFELVDSYCLKKKSVVRNAEYDIDVDNIAKRLGSVGTRDRRALNIAEVTFTAMPQHTLGGQVAPKAREYSPAPNREKVGKYQHLTPEEGNLLEAVLLRHTIDSPTSCITALLSELQLNDAFRTTLTTTGLPYAMIGQFTIRLMTKLGLPTFSPLKMYLDPVLETHVMDNEFEFACIIDDSNLPMLVLRSADSRNPRVPVSALNQSGQALTVTDQEAEVPEHVRFEIPDDYLVPDLIILDQYSSSMIVGGSRCDLKQALVDLRAEGSAPAYVIGSGTEPGWRGFQDAAENLGWQIERVESRLQTLATVCRLARATESIVVTLVTRHGDLVAELENTGFQVNIVSTVVDELEDEAVHDDDDTGLK